MFLTLDQWIHTMQRLIRHESRGQQFLQNARFGGSVSNRYRFGANFFADERGQPLFGAPHGYGIAQLDTPRPTIDQVFSFLENIRGAIRLTMLAKAQGAWSSLHAHFGNDQRSRAVFRREVVRRYNGHTEFIWNGTDFVIRPSFQWADPSDHTKGPNPNLRYPNQVLGTTITYSTGTGAGTAFPWPIAFPSTQYGPGI
jgi:hypothetical protein